MSYIQAWLVPVDGEPQSIRVPMHDYVGYVRKTYFNDRTLDITKVRFKGKVCSMLLDDLGMVDGFPVNIVATEAYQANCKPGTTHSIHGTAVIFGGLLP